MIDEKEKTFQEQLIEKVANAILNIETENDKQSWLSLEELLPKREDGYDIKSLFKAIIKILHADRVKLNTVNEELREKAVNAYLKAMNARESGMDARESKKKDYTPKPSKKVDIETIKDDLKFYKDEITIIKEAYKNDKKYSHNNSYEKLFELGSLSQIIEKRQSIDLYIHITPNEPKGSKLINLTEFSIIAYDRYNALNTYFTKNDIELYETIVAIDTIINNYGITFKKSDNCLKRFLSLLTNKSMNYDKYKLEYVTFMKNINELCKEIGITTLDSKDIKNLSLNNFIPPSEKTKESVEFFLKNHGYSKLDLNKIVTNLKDTKLFDIRKKIKIYLDNIMVKIANAEPNSLEEAYQLQVKNISRKQLKEQIFNSQKNARKTFNEFKDFLESNKDHMETNQKEKYEEFKKKVSQFPSESFIPWNKIVVGSLVAAVVGSIGYGLYKYFQNTKTSIIPKLRIPIKT